MEPIIRILVEDILTFAYCEDNQIAEDFSVAQLERIAYALRKSEQPIINAFLNEVKQMANDSRASDNIDRAQQLDALPVHLGLI